MRLVNLPPKLAQTIRLVAITALHRRGVSAPSRAQVDKECDDVLRALEALDQGKESEHVVLLDHTDDLLRRARRHLREAKHNLACLHFAIWVEHKLNQWLASLARAKSWPDQDVEAMIRETQHRAKLGWLLRAFGVPPFAKRHRDAVQQLMDRRNAFVHYKWRQHKPSDTEDLAAFLLQFEGTIRYFRRYEQRTFGIISRRKAKQMLETLNE